MKKVMPVFILLCFFMMFVGASSCDDNSSDTRQRDQQELILSEATRQIGMPAIPNFREKKIMRMILEMRDQANLITYTYVYIPMIGKFRFIGETVGYPIPYATQFTNPQKLQHVPSGGYTTLPQADPNAMFSPASADGTWVLMKLPGGDDVDVVYMEEKINTFPKRLPAKMVVDD